MRWSERKIPVLFDRFTPTEHLASSQKPLAHRCQNPCLECHRELVDFPRNLAYPTAGSKTNIYDDERGQVMRSLMNRLLVCNIVVVGLYLTGCGTYEYRKRPDASEVAVIRDIQKVFPEFASEVTSVLEGFKVRSGFIEGSLGRGEIKNTIVRLYDQKDQLNAQLRDFVVARYQSYINAELDPDRAARERGRKDWNDVTAKVQEVALDLRKVKELIDKASREHAEAIEKSNEIQKQKIDSAREISKTGMEIEAQSVGFVKTIQDPNLERAVHQVRFSNGQLEDALRTDKVTRARAAADNIQVSVAQIWDPKHTGATDKAIKAIALSHELQRRVDNHVKIAMKLAQQQAVSEEEYVAGLKEAIDSLKSISARLLATVE